MESLSFAALLLFWATVKKTEKDSTPSLYAVPGILPLFCIWVYFIIQMVPLPSAVVNAVSPATYRLYTATVGVFDPEAWISLSFQKKATLAEFLRFSSCAAFYILTVQLLSRKKRLTETVSVIITFTALLALFAILQNLTSARKIFWFREIELGSPFGPFVNRNHYAGLMGMLFPIVLSMFLALRPKVNYTSMREKISELMGRRHANIYMLVGLSAILAGISVLLSLSRSGIVCVALSTAFLGAMLMLKAGKRGGILVLLVVSLLVALSVGWAGWGTLMERFSTIKNIHGDIGDLRPVIWRDSLSMIKDFPVTGTGLGTFVSAYPGYRSFPTEWTIGHAHNDYVELLSEGGLTVFLLATWFFISIIYSSFGCFLKRKDSYSIYLYLGCIAGMASILLHSFTDFNLHIASNGLYLFFLCGLAVSAAHTRLHDSKSPTHLKIILAARVSLWRMGALGMLVLTIIVNAGIMAGESFFLPIRDWKVGSNDSPADIAHARNIAERASIFDPLDPRYRYASGVIKELSSGRESLPYFKQAVSLDPLNSEYLQRLGLILFRNGEPQKGDMLMKEGVTLDPTNPARYKSYAIFLISRGDKEAALSNIRKALAIAPDRSDDFVMLMMLHRMNDDEIAGTLPPRAAAHLAFAKYLFLSGRSEQAEKAYADALYFASREKDINMSYFDKIYNYYMKAEKFEKALNVMKQASAALPNNGELHFRAGSLYEKLGMNSLAAEEYQKALTLSPHLIEAKKRIEEINAKTGRTSN